LGIHGRVREQQRQQHAAELVARLLDADTTQVPEIVAEIVPYRQWADPLLRRANAEAGEEPRQKLHTSLALLPVDPGQREYLYGRLIRAEASPLEVVILRKELRAHRADLIERLWQVLENPPADRRQRLRAACALADYDPESTRWTSVSAAVVSFLVAENPALLGQWLDALRPVHAVLEPPLIDVFRSRTADQGAREVAASTLAEYVTEPALLADLIQDADPRQYAMLWPRLEHRAEALGSLEQEIAKTAEAGVSEEARDSLAKRQANAAVTLLRLGQLSRVWPLLRHSRDPSLRSYLISRFAPLGCDPQALIGRLQVEPDTAVRQALILSLGESFEDTLSEEQDQALTRQLVHIYGSDPDPGIHSAVAWLLRHRQHGDQVERVDNEFRGKGIQGDRGWFVDTQGQTFAIVHARSFLMGSPEDERGRMPEEKLHLEMVGRTFAIATKPVTIEEFQRFLQANPAIAKDYVPARLTLPAMYSPGPDGPAIAVTWFEAAQYCNWLSEQEGIKDENQMCYPRVAQIKENVQLPVDYLDRPGYRLPTEAEWEYACRAGAVTSRCYGTGEELLGQYAWFASNSREHSWPVGQLKPNDFGLFDMQGNVWQWCQDVYLPYSPQAGLEIREDRESLLLVTRDEFLLVRRHATVALGGVIPLSKGKNKPFDWELNLEVNYHFGALVRRSGDRATPPLD
jgi:formylglycine-generating enzyme required for sulfatase activity